MADEEDEDTSGSILNDTKKALGLAASYSAFDPDLIMHINSTLTILWDLGIGPEEVVVITGPDDNWSLLDLTPEQLSMVKSWLYLKVRIVFDPPTMGFLVDSLKAQIEEQTYRLRDRREATIPRITESEVDPEWCP